MFRTLLVVFLFLISLESSAQDFRSQRNKFLAFNVGFNGLVGGVGAIINKNENQTGGRAFLNGFYKGAIGGTVSHIGFSLTHQILVRENISYAWPSRIVNSIGASFVQNAAENRDLLDRIHFNLYVTRLEYFPRERNFKARIFSSSIYGIIVTGRNATLNISKSLQSGVLYFESSEYFRSSLVQGRATGQVSSIGMGTDMFPAEYYDIFAHELAHILQFDRKIGGNAFISRADQKWKEKHQWYKQVSRFLYFDLNGPIFYAAYHFQNSTHNCNFFEQEAENYSSKRYYGCR